METKLFSSDQLFDLESKINIFQYSRPNITINSINISAHPMHDRHLNDGSICDQWTEYIAIIIFK